MKKSLVAMLTAGSAALGGCQFHQHEDEGATATRNYSIGNFQKIEVAGPYEVEVHTGGNPAVNGQGPEKLLERTRVEVRGDTLIISPAERHGWFHFGWSSHRGAHFIVTVPQLAGAAIAGSGDIGIDKVQSAQFEGSVAGSGGLNIGNVDVQTLKFSIAGSGDIKAQAGKATSAKYDIAGSGDIDVRSVGAQDLEVTIAGSGGVKAHATGTAKVSIIGSGDVNVTGGAKCTVSKTGSGDANCS